MPTNSYTYTIKYPLKSTFDSYRTLFNVLRFKTVCVIKFLFSLAMEMSLSRSWRDKQIISNILFLLLCYNGAWQFWDFILLFTGVVYTCIFRKLTDKKKKNNILNFGTCLLASCPHTATTIGTYTTVLNYIV